MTLILTPKQHTVTKECPTDTDRPKSGHLSYMSIRLDPSYAQDNEIRKTDSYEASDRHWQDDVRLVQPPTLMCTYNYLLHQNRGMKSIR